MSLRFVDPMSVSNEKGRFVLRCKAPLDRIYAKVQARNLAQRWGELTPGHDLLLRMQTGVEVTGRVICEGKPVEGAAVGAISADRGAGNGYICDPVGTGKDGIFVLANLPPEHEFLLYVAMDSLHGLGAVTSEHIKTGKNKTTQDLHTLPVERGHRLAGRIVLSDGRPIPANTRMLLGLQDAWDHSEALIDNTGHFEFAAVPASSISLSVRIAGYKFSKSNPSLDWLNGGIVGRLSEDVNDLVLLMEPGEFHWDENQKEIEKSGMDPQPRSKPLRGATP